MKNSFLSIGLASLIVFSCTPEKDIEIPVQFELITSLVLTLTPEQGGDTLVRVFEVNDPDGKGGLAPTLQNDTLKANTTYKAVIELFDESGEEIKVVTPEIKMTDEDHQFFFKTTADVTFTYLDFDSNNRPLGLETRVVTGNPSQAPLTITLLHFPNKTAAGVAQGDITNAGGSTDITVTFDLLIE